MAYLSIMSNNWLWLNSKDLHDALILLNETVADTWLIRSDSKYALSQSAQEFIQPFHEECKKLMDDVRERLYSRFGDRIKFQGGATGLFFKYSRLTMFRFHPKEVNNDLVLHVRLPNLNDERSQYKFNELYLSKIVLEKTDLLEVVVDIHLKMVDKIL